jgi:hypothetical protein
MECVLARYDIALTSAKSLTNILANRTRIMNRFIGQKTAVEGWR